jgi:hypothetical protein
MSAITEGATSPRNATPELGIVSGGCSTSSRPPPAISRPRVARSPVRPSCLLRVFGSSGRARETHSSISTGIHRAFHGLGVVTK